MNKNTTREELIEKIKEVYHVYETYGGTDITDIDL